MNFGRWQLVWWWPYWGLANLGPWGPPCRPIYRYRFMVGPLEIRRFA